MFEVCKMYKFEVFFSVRMKTRNNNSTYLKKILDLYWKFIILNFNCYVFVVPTS